MGFMKWKGIALHGHGIHMMDSVHIYARVPPCGWASVSD
jgi:hypothetical protein